MGIVKHSVSWGVDESGIQTLGVSLYISYVIGDVLR